MTSKTGRCLCGDVTYRFGETVHWTSHCHCESCRRATASPVTTFFAVPLSEFGWTGKEPQGFASSPGVERRFCDRCGTPISYAYDGKPDEIHLYAATLDDDSGLSVESYDFWNERVAWLQIEDDLRKDER